MDTINYLRRAGLRAGTSVLPIAGPLAGAYLMGSDVANGAQRLMPNQRLQQQPANDLMYNQTANLAVTDNAHTTPQFAMPVNPAIPSTTVDTPPVVAPVTPVVTNTPQVDTTTKYSDQQIADMHNMLQGKSTAITPTQPGTSGGYENMLKEFLADRGSNRGMYKLQETGYSPDQQANINAGADAYYSSNLARKLTAEKLDATNKANGGAVDLASANGQYLNNLGTLNFGSAANRTSTMASLANITDPTAQYEGIKRVALGTLSVGDKKRYFDSDLSNTRISSLNKFTPEDLTSSPYKYVGQSMAKYLGGSNDRRYQDFQAVVGGISAPIISDLYGAVLAAEELKKANTFIPDLATDSVQNTFLKLNQMQAVHAYANDKQLYDLGVGPKPNFDDYINNARNGRGGATEKNTNFATPTNTNSNTVTSRGGISF